MAIRFDSEYNAEIRRIVHNFNQKRNRAIKRGFTHLPPLMKVSELKARYQTREQLNRELNLLKQFNAEKDDALKIVETSGGAKAIQWELDYLKSNLRYARDFYDREIQKATTLETDLNVTKLEYLNNLRAKRDYLNLEITELNPSQLRTFRSTINEYLYANTRNLQGYRNWMNEVEIIMRHLGYDNRTINQFFSGFEDLTPREFLTMYQQSALISRIYELYIPSREQGEFKLSTTEDDAKELINTFMLEKEEMIRRAKNNEKMSDTQVLDEFVRSLNDTVLEENKKPKKLQRKDLSPKQIEDLKSLGWEDLIK